MKVRLDGAVVAEINGDETVDIELTKQGAVLQLKQLTAKSNKLTVSPGDSVKIVFKKWVYWEPVFAGLVTFLSAFLVSYLRSFSILEESSIWIIGSIALIITGLLIVLPSILFEKYILYKE